MDDAQDMTNSTMKGITGTVNYAVYIFLFFPIYFPD